MSEEWPMKWTVWRAVAERRIEANEKRLDAFGFWMDKHREMHVKDIDKLLDELESQHLDRRIIELDDVMRNNFTRRLDELEESYKDHLDWASTHGHPDPPQETPKGHAEFICDSCGKIIGEHDKYVVHETYRHFECAGFLPQETPKGYWWCRTHDRRSCPTGCPRSMFTMKCNVEWRGPPQETPTEDESECEHRWETHTETECGAGRMYCSLCGMEADEPGGPINPEEPEGKIELDDTNVVMTDATKRYIAKPEGMERYIGMPCIFGNTPEYINSFVAELREIKDFGPMAANYCVSWGSLFQHCKPHPTSEELVRLREERAQLEKISAGYEESANRLLRVTLAQEEETARLKIDLGHEKSGRNILAGELSKSQAELVQYGKMKTNIELFIYKLSTGMTRSMTECGVRRRLQDCLTALDIENGDNQHSARTGG